MVGIAKVATRADYGALRRALAVRALVLGPLFCVAFLGVFWIGWLLILAEVWVPDGLYPSIDFFAFWTGSSLALEGQAAEAYDEMTIWRERLQLPGNDNLYHVWLNPPVFFFFVLPLSLVPVAGALAGWLLATGTLLFSAVRRMSSSRTVLMLALAFPATFYNMVIGQNGFLTAGLFAWGMLLLRDRPVLAGALLGLMTYKPQFLPLVLVALLAGGQRKALASAMASGSAICLASLAAFGLESWEAFMSVALAGDSIYTTDGSLGVSLYKMQSVSASLLLLGVSPLATQVTQILTTLGCLAFVVWLWRRDADLSFKASGLALAVLLATPYSYHYDLTLLGLAGLWLGLQCQAEGWRAGEREVLVLAWMTPLLGLAAGVVYDLAIAPAVMLLLLAVLLRRLTTSAGFATAPGSKVADFAT